MHATKQLELATGQIVFHATRPAPTQRREPARGGADTLTRLLNNRGLLINRGLLNNRGLLSSAGFLLPDRAQALADRARLMLHRGEVLRRGEF